MNSKTSKKLICGILLTTMLFSSNVAMAQSSYEFDLKEIELATSANRTGNVVAKAVSEIPPVYHVPDEPEGVNEKGFRTYFGYFNNFWGAHGGGNMRNRDEVTMYIDSSGQMNMTVYKNHKLQILTYDASGQNLLRQRELNFDTKYIWGGLYYAEGFLYVVIGVENFEQDDDKVVIEVQKYRENSLQLDKTVEIKSSAYSGGINRPFDSGNVTMQLYAGDQLLLRAPIILRGSMQGEDCTRYQRGMDFIIDFETMEAQTTSSVSAGGLTFNQKVAKQDDNTIWTIDHDAGYRKGIILRIHDFNFKRLAAQRLVDVDGIPTMSSTNLTADSFMIGKQANLLVGTFVSYMDVGMKDDIVTFTGFFENVPEAHFTENSEDYANDVLTNRNVFLLVLDKITGMPTYRQITDFKYNEFERIYTSEPRLVQLNEDRFVLLFSVVRLDANYKATAMQMEYRQIDSLGNILDSKSYPNVPFSAQMDPIYSDGKIFWLDSPQAVALSDQTHYLYSLQIDPEEPVDIEKIDAFVKRLYRTGLDREADTSGLDFWNNGLANKSMTGAGAAENFLNSEELKNKNLSDGNYLDTLYRALMDRESDTGGKAYWQSFLDGGISRTGVLRQFLLSPEFQKICDSYGITRGEPSVIESRDENLQLTMFINRQYEEILGRSSDVGGVNFWSESVLDGASVEEVSKQFVFSEEFTNRGYSQEAFIKILYKAFMGREADLGGLEHWLDEMNAGMSREDVFTNFAYSQEFKEIVDRFNILSSVRIPESSSGIIPIEIPSIAVPTPSQTAIPSNPTPSSIGEIHPSTVHRPITIELVLPNMRYTLVGGNVYLSVYVSGYVSEVSIRYPDGEELARVRDFEVSTINSTNGPRWYRFQFIATGEPGMRDVVVAVRGADGHTVYETVTLDIRPENYVHTA